MSKVLVVEDDKNLSFAVREVLLLDNHTVEVVNDGSEALDLLRAYQYDLVILDWELPGASGIEICRQFRTTGGASPILFLTGKKSIDDKEAGFSAGADDYLTKPFNVRELAARVKALLRRPVAYSTDTLVVGPLVMQPTKFELTCHGEVVNLLPKEFALLEFFMRHPGQIFSADALLGRVWPNESDATPEALRQTISRLRNKIDQKGDKQSLIRTVINVGYKLDVSST